MVSIYTPDTLILASKGFTLFSLSGKLVIFILATLVSLHYYIFQKRVKLAPSASENGERYFCVYGSDVHVYRQ